MGVFTKEQFSRSQSEDLETAIALAVKAVLARDFPGPGGIGSIKIEEFFEDWADMTENFVNPSAAILPNDELKYGPSHPTPRFLEDTWEPKGEQGFGLSELSEASREFEVAVLASEAAERNALKAGIETAFQDPRGLLVVKGPAPIGETMTGGGNRSGVLVQAMPEYWSLPCRLTLLASRKLDDADSVSKKNFEARFRLRAEAPHVILQPMQPFRLRLTVIEQDPSGNPI